MRGNRCYRGWLSKRGWLIALSYIGTPPVGVLKWRGVGGYINFVEVL